MTRPRKAKNPHPPLSPETEARMIYIPLDDRTRPVTVHMYEAERKRAVAALDPVIYALSDAGHVFGLIHTGLACGYFSRSDAGLISLANICAAHFNALAEKEGEHLAMLQTTLKQQEPPKDPEEENP
jgi:hypothetical protein